MTRKSERARELRRDGSRAERICWELIRAHRLDGIKFRRQHPIGPYFADIACVSRRLVIEIDGDHHADQLARDARRTTILEQAGWHVIRFTAREIVENPEGIRSAIRIVIENGASPPLLASPPSGERKSERRDMR